MNFYIFITPFEFYTYLGATDPDATQKLHAHRDHQWRPSNPYALKQRLLYQGASATLSATHALRSSFSALKGLDAYCTYTV